MIYERFPYKEDVSTPSDDSGKVAVMFERLSRVTRLDLPPETSQWSDSKAAEHPVARVSRILQDYCDIHGVSLDTERQICGGSFRFDFAFTVNGRTIVVEYDDASHFNRKGSNNVSAKFALLQTQSRDIFKMLYALHHDWLIVRITHPVPTKSVLHDRLDIMRTSIRPDPLWTSRSCHTYDSYWSCLQLYRNRPITWLNHHEFYMGNSPLIHEIVSEAIDEQQKPESVPIVLAPPTPAESAALRPNANYSSEKFYNWIAKMLR